MSCQLLFDAATHTYTLDGRVVPSVTRVLGKVIGHRFMASDWHLQRGTAIHACAAMVCLGKEFTCDPRIAGEVEAVRRFVKDNVSLVISVEQPVASVVHQFAGMPDLVCVIDGRRVIVDWKKSLDVDMVSLQLGGYRLAMRSDTYQPRYGIGVQTNEDGTYKATKLIDLKPFSSEFAACRTVYGIRDRLGLLQNNKQEESADE